MRMYTELEKVGETHPTELTKPKKMTKMKHY